MNLFPQNLRDRQHADLIRRRSLVQWMSGSSTGLESHFSSDPLPPRRGFLGKLWAKGSGLTDSQAATGLPNAANSTQTTAFLLPIPLLLITWLLTAALTSKGVLPVGETVIAAAVLSAAAIYLSAVPIARSSFRSLYTKPLSVTEIDAMLERTDDELGQAHLRLVRDAIRQPVPERAEETLRLAIQALGEAIDRLPSVMVQPLDVAATRREAQEITAQAAQEPNRVISESLERRADALLRRADAHERSALVARRADALRAEITTQIDALREGIAALASGDAAITGQHADLTHLAESAQRVAREADSAADAREELNRYVTEPVTSNENKAALRIGGGVR